MDEHGQNTQHDLYPRALEGAAVLSRHGFEQLYYLSIYLNAKNVSGGSSVTWSVVVEQLFHSSRL